MSAWPRKGRRMQSHKKREKSMGVWGQMKHVHINLELHSRKPQDFKPRLRLYPCSRLWALIIVTYESLFFISYLVHCYVLRRRTGTGPARPLHAPCMAEQIFPSFFFSLPAARKGAARMHGSSSRSLLKGKYNVWLACQAVGNIRHVFISEIRVLCETSIGRITRQLKLCLQGLVVTCVCHTNY